MRKLTQNNAFRVLVSIPFKMDDESEAKSYLNVFDDVFSGLYQDNVVIKTFDVQNKVSKNGDLYVGQISFDVQALSEEIARNYFLTTFKEFMGILFKNIILDDIDIATISPIIKGKSTAVVLAAFAEYKNLLRFGEKVRVKISLSSKPNALLIISPTAHIKQTIFMTESEKRKEEIREAADWIIKTGQHDLYESADLWSTYDMGDNITDETPIEAVLSFIAENRGVDTVIENYISQLSQLPFNKDHVLKALRMLAWNAYNESPSAQEKWDTDHDTSLDYAPISDVLWFLDETTFQESEMLYDSVNPEGHRHKPQHKELAKEPWSEADDKLLLEKYRAGSTTVELCDQFKRTRWEIKRRLRQHIKEGHVKEREHPDKEKVQELLNLIKDHLSWMEMRADRESREAGRDLRDFIENIGFKLP